MYTLAILPLIMFSATGADRSVAVPQAPFVIDLHASGPDGAAFHQGATSLMLYQFKLGGIDAYGPKDLLFDANGDGSVSLQSLGDVDPTKSVWAVVVDVASTPNAESSNFFASADEGKKGLVRLIFSAPDPQGVRTAAGNVQLVSPPLYCQVRTADQPPGPDYSLFVSNRAEVSSTRFDRLSVARGDEYTEVYSWSKRDSVGATLQSPTADVYFRGQLKRGSKTTLMTSSLGHIRIDIDDALYDEMHSVYIVPDSSYAASTPDQEGSSLKQLLRLQGAMAPFRCYRIRGSNDFEADGMKPGPYTIEVWRKSDLSGAAPFTPYRTGSVQILAGQKISHIVN